MNPEHTDTDPIPVLHQSLRCSCWIHPSSLVVITYPCLSRVYVCLVWNLYIYIYIYTYTHINIYIYIYIYINLYPKDYIFNPLGVFDS